MPYRPLSGPLSWALLQRGRVSRWGQCYPCRRWSTVASVLHLLVCVRSPQSCYCVLSRPRVCRQLMQFPQPYRKQSRVPDALISDSRVRGLSQEHAGELAVHTCAHARALTRVCIRAHARRLTHTLTHTPTRRTLCGPSPAPRRVGSASCPVSPVGWPALAREVWAQTLLWAPSHFSPSLGL